MDVGIAGAHFQWKCMNVYVAYAFILCVCVFVWGVCVCLCGVCVYVCVCVSVCAFVFVSRSRINHLDTQSDRRACPHLYYLDYCMCMGIL